MRLQDEIPLVLSPTRPHVLVRFAVLLAAVAMSASCAFIGLPPNAGPGIIAIRMNPDSTKFAYALDYHRYQGWFDPLPQSGKVELWIYDLAHRTGPIRVGSWWHDWKSDAQVLQWTKKGIYVAYFHSGGVGCDLVNPKSGWRWPIGTPPWDVLRKERPGGPDPNQVAEYRHTRHVEENAGEFWLWDPARLQLDSLFTLPLDAYLGDDLRSSAISRREVLRRQDGFQGIDRVDTALCAQGVLLHVHTYARRAAPFLRRYRLTFEYTVPEPGSEPYETVVAPEAMWDTTVAPNPAGEALAVYLPYARFMKVLRPARPLLRGYGASPYLGNLVTTLVPDSIEGDAYVPPGIRDGGWGWNWTPVVVPLPQGTSRFR